MREPDEIILPDGRRLPLERGEVERREGERSWTDALPVFVRPVNGYRDRRRGPRYDVRARRVDLVI